MRSRAFVEFRRGIERQLGISEVGDLLLRVNNHGFSAVHLPLRKGNGVGIRPVIQAIN